MKVLGLGWWIPYLALASESVNDLFLELTLSCNL